MMKCETIIMLDYCITFLNRCSSYKTNILIHDYIQELPLNQLHITLILTYIWIWNKT